MKFVLEGYKGFTIIAWITVILFTAFTYSLTRELNQKVERLGPTDAVAELERQHGIAD